MLQPAGSWPQCYDSLTLFSPARCCALPGLPFPGDQRRHPHRDGAAAYLRQYADHFELPVRTGSHVAAVRMHPDGFTVELSGDKALTARAVVAATGLVGAPEVPALPGHASCTGELLHTSADRRPAASTGQRVVVVGGGNSAIQIAVERARVARVSLARSPLTIRRQRPLGVDLHHWLHDGRTDRLPLGRRAAASFGVLDDGQHTAALAALPEAYEPDDWPAQRRGTSTTVPGLGHLVRQLQRQPSTARPRRATVPVGGCHG